MNSETIFIIEKTLQPDGEQLIKKYIRGNLIGKGGFARVYEVTDPITNKKMAGKVIPKSSMQSPELKQKLVAEIAAHKILKHPHIVNLETAFEDKDNIYILLELCSTQTFSDLVAKRQRLTEIEVQSYMFQLIDAMKYMHSKKIIHRDIKPKNLFLTENMELKLGDFGLSVKLNTSNEKRFSVCGTTNYIAPEVIAKTGHSYPVDIWSLGIVIYCLLFGATPFDNPDNKIVYKKIKEASFSFPPEIPVSSTAKDLITKILVKRPEKRLSLDEILQHPFFANPKQIIRPVGRLSVAPASRSNSAKSSPKTEKQDNMDRRNSQGRRDSEGSVEDHQSPNPNINPRITSSKFRFSESSINPRTSIKMQGSMVNHHPTFKEETNGSTKTYEITDLPMNKQKQYGMDDLRNLPELNKVKSSWAAENLGNKGEDTSVGVIKWLDYASKYGMGYMLSDGSIGILLNDHSRIFCRKDSKEFIYFEGTEGSEKISHYKFDRYPENLEKKVALYNHFKEYLENDMAGVSIVTSFNKEVFKKSKSNEHNGDSKHSVYVSKWLKTKNAIFFKMNTKVMQIVFKDGAVIILNPYANNVEYIGQEGAKSYHKLTDVQEIENQEIAKRIKYVQETLKEIWRSMSTGERSERKEI